MLDQNLAKPPRGCELCGANVARRLWSLHFDGYPGRFSLWQCQCCGVVFNWPRQPSEAIHDQYNGDYYVFSSPPERCWGRAVQTYVSLLGPLEGRCPGNRLLDVGCAQGHLLALARGRGWCVEGVEISQEAAASASAEFDLTIRVGTLEDHASHIDPFNVVISTDVIEHVTSPQRFVQAIRQVLVPGGWAIVETPNWGGWWRRLGGRRWLGLNRFHLFLFDGQSLSRLMEDCGLAVSEMRSSTSASGVDWAWRPELAPLSNRLPAGLQWRARKLLSWATPRNLGMALNQNPPRNLDEALVRVEHLLAVRPENYTSSRLLGDNLAVWVRA
ncbi:MAG: class I SAM-dependent methyltransferase [Phycisphaerales bacterium]|nr:class I SAM-dependent methyltransferase [Phycisphaerales bacterium]